MANLSINYIPSSLYLFWLRVCMVIDIVFMYFVVASFGDKKTSASEYGLLLLPLFTLFLQEF